MSTLKSGSSGYISNMQSCIVNKETTDVTVTRGTLWSDNVILALLSKIVYEYKGNTTYVIQEKTALISYVYVFEK